MQIRIEVFIADSPSERSHDEDVEKFQMEASRQHLSVVENDVETGNSATEFYMVGTKVNIDAWLERECFEPEEVEVDTEDDLQQHCSYCGHDVWVLRTPHGTAYTPHGRIRDGKFEGVDPWTENCPGSGDPA